MEDSDDPRDDTFRGLGSPFSKKFLRFGVIGIGVYLFFLTLGCLPPPWPGFLITLVLFTLLIYSFHNTGTISEEEDDHDTDEDEYAEIDSPTIFFSVPSTGMHDHVPEFGYDNDVRFRSIMILSQMDPKKFR